VAAEERGTLGISWRKWRREIHPSEDLIPSITHLLVMEKGRVIDKGRKEKILGKKSLADILGDLSRSPSRPHPAPIS
jgi:hypothetical protein